MGTTFKIVGFVFPAVVVLSWMLIWPCFDVIGDYTRTIEVDDSSKVEWAISNAVDDVKSRGFIVNTLNIRHRLFGKTFQVSCSGIERGNLLRK